MDIEEAKEQLLKHKKEIDAKFISARYSKAIEVVLSELDKKDKIINEMAEHMEKGCDFNNFFKFHRIQTKEQILKYFKNKVEEDIKE